MHHFLIPVLLSSSPSKIYLAKDSFTRADGPLGNAETGQAWDTSYATNPAMWQVLVGRAAYPTSTASGLAVIDVLTTNAKVGANITFSSNDGFVLRLQDSANHYILRIASSGLGLFRNVASTSTQVSNYAFTPVVGQVYNLIAECSGTTIRVYLDGVQRFEAINETQFSTLTKFGLRSSSSANGRYDDFTVEAL